MCVKILDSLKIKKISVDNVISFARKLDIHFQDSRYPINGAPSDFFDEVMAVELFVCLERIQNFCEKYLKEE